MLNKEVKEAKKIHELFLEFDHWFQSPTLFILRVIWGVLFIFEGWHKFSDIPSTVNFYKSLGFGSPELMVYLSASAEFFGGLLLVIGLLSRLAAIPLLITMVVAAVTAPSSAVFLGHGTGQTETFLSQIPLVFGYACLMIILFGPGKWSLDYYFRDKFFLCR
ncbi:MAG: DoxX family protein [Deltaproteobacteria bacterium]|nr:DoxX family protein [Deltaproteobacteria bacterium]